MKRIVIFLSLLIVATVTGEGAVWVSTYTGSLIKVDAKINQAVTQFNLGTCRMWAVTDNTLRVGNSESTHITRMNLK